MLDQFLASGDIMNEGPCPYPVENRAQKGVTLEDEQVQSKPHTRIECL